MLTEVMYSDFLSAMQSFVESNGYFLIFLVMVVEGPTVTSAAGFAASLGYFNVWIIFVLAVLGDIVGDVLYFLMGRYFGKKYALKFFNYFRLDKTILEKMENKVQENLGKTLFFVKFTPVAGMCILFIGSLNTSFKKVLSWITIITFPKALFFTFLGFFFGLVMGKILNIFALGQYAIFAILVLVLLVYYINKKTVPKIKSLFFDKNNKKFNAR